MADNGGMALIPPAEPVDFAAVELVDDCVLIHELSVNGGLVELLRSAVEDGRDPELLVRQALDVGAAVLSHGAAQGTMDAVTSEVTRLLDLLDEKTSGLHGLALMRTKVSSSKGLDWEASLAPALDACCAPLGDELEVTGLVVGVADSKVGDYVVTLNPRDTGGRDRRIVLEAKARSRRSTVANALEELDRAMLNRQAQVGVMVFANRSGSPLQKPLRFYHGDRILVVYDPEGDPGSELALEVAVHLARALALTAEREDLKLDRAMLGERLNTLTNVIERGRQIKRGIASARKGLDAAEDAYESMAEEAMAVVLEIQDRL
jgi:hypothetical protein